MATLVFTAIGTLLGGPLGGAIGALAGRQVDSLILGGGGGREGPRLNELSVTTSSYGMPIPRHFGRMRVAGQIIWATDLVEHKESSGGGKGRPSTTSYSYSASFAVALASRPIRSVGRIWADGKLLRGAAGDLKAGGTLRVHTGNADQTLDPLLASAETPGQSPAYTGLAYAVFEDLQLADFGNRLPALTFEILADDAPLSFATILEGVIDNTDADVPLAGVAGFSMEGSVEDALAALDPLFPVDCDACDDRLMLRPDRQQMATIALPEAATSTERDDFGGAAGFARKRAPEAEQPVAVLRYYDVDRDYQPGAQRAVGRPAAGQPRTIELPAALPAASARALIDSASRRTTWARQTVSWRVTQLDPKVRPGATVSLPGHPGLWRVREWEWRTHGVDLTLVRLSPQTSASLVADSGRPLTAPDRTVPATVVAACEVPWDGNPGTPVPQLVVVGSGANPAWAGAGLYADLGDGSLQALGQTGRVRGMIGTTLNALTAASPLLVDRFSSLIVSLCADDLPLAPATLRQLAQGANRAVVGEEIIQFASAEPLGNSNWRLSHLLRGRGGTEHAVMGHSAGETVILLDGAMTVIDAQAVSTGSVVAIGLGDPQPVSAMVQLSGIGHRPLTPVHGQCHTLANGDRLVRWVRRSRGAWLWLDGVEVPVNEQDESYVITFENQTQVFARWATTAPSLTIVSATAASLAATAPDGRLMIRQRGDRALSAPLSLPFI